MTRFFTKQRRGVFTLWFPMMASAENLVRNPSFEGDEKAFVVNRMETPRERVKAKDDPRYVSRPDTRHVRDGKRAWFLRCENPKGRNNMAFMNLPVTPGKRYVFKARYYLDDADGSAGVPRAAQADRRGTGEVG